MELWNYFSYDHPKANFIPAFKDRRWDGKVRLLDLRTGKLPLGLHTLTKDYCDQMGYEVVYDDPIDVENPFSVEEFRRMIGALKLSATDDGVRFDITPHDYQERGIIHAIQSNRCLLLSATASGKSLMIYVLLRYYLAKTKGKILIIVPTTALVRQLHDDFVDYAFKTDFDVPSMCHMVYDGGEKRTDKRVTISTWQALAVKERLPKEILDELKAEKTPAQVKAIVKKWNKQAPYILEPEFFHDFTVVFGDECHKFSSEDPAGGGELEEIMSKLINARYRIGTTGTLRDAKVHHMVLEGIFGKVYKVVSTREMIDQKKAAELYIKCIQFQYTEAERKLMRKKSYPEEMEFLQSHQHRNRFIRDHALSLDGNTLVLFEKIDKHGKILYDMIKAKIAPGRKLFFVYGKTPTEDRNEIRKITEGETDAIIVASYGTFSEGVNIRNINSIIFASPTKAKVRVLQSIGRGLRLSRRKWMVTLYDLADDLSVWNKSGTMVHDNYSLQHFTERINFYISEQFDYKLYKCWLEPNEIQGLSEK
jgi:superfamily II DNA or RNA helicase